MPFGCKRALLPLGLFALCALPTHAEEFEAPANVGPYLIFGASQVQFESPQSLTIPSATQLTLGAGWQYDPHWSVEVAHQSGNIDASTIDTRFSQSRISSVYRLTPRIKISWVVRADIIKQSFKQALAERSSGSALGLAVGYDLHFGESLFMNVSSGPIIGFDGGYSDWQTSLTVNYFFGVRYESGDDEDEQVVQYFEPEEEVYYLPQIVEQTLPQSELEPEAKLDIPADLLTEPVAELEPYSDLPVTINFELNSSLLQPQYMEILDRLGETLRSAKNFDIEVTGHSDETGPTQYNLWLSQRRAERVAKYLVDKFQLHADSIKVKWLGAQSPMATNDSDLHRAMNRRVEITGSIEK